MREAFGCPGIPDLSRSKANLKRVGSESVATDAEQPPSGRNRGSASQTAKGKILSTQGYEPKHRTSRTRRTAKGRRRGFTVTMVAGLLVGAGLMYAPAYGFSGLLGGLVPGVTSGVEQETEPKVTDVDRIEGFDASLFDNSESEVASPPPLPESDPVFIVEFTDEYGTDLEEFACHDDSFDGAELDPLDASEGV
jgi:hypothetical protein